MAYKTDTADALRAREWLTAGFGGFDYGGKF
jgi:hypothetical protein